MLKPMTPNEQRFLMMLGRALERMNSLANAAHAVIEGHDAQAPDDTMAYKIGDLRAAYHKVRDDYPSSS